MPSRRPTPAPPTLGARQSWMWCPLTGGAEPHRRRCCIRGAWLSLAPGPPVQPVCCSSVPWALPWFQGPRCCPREGGQLGAQNRVRGQEVQEPPTPSVLTGVHVPWGRGWGNPRGETGRRGRSPPAQASSCPSKASGLLGAKLSPCGESQALTSVLGNCPWRRPGTEPGSL